MLLHSGPTAAQRRRRGGSSNILHGIQDSLTKHPEQLHEILESLPLIFALYLDGFILNAMLLEAPSVSHLFLVASAVSS